MLPKIPLTVEQQQKPQRQRQRTELNYFEQLQDTLQKHVFDSFEWPDYQFLSYLLVAGFLGTSFCLNYVYPQK